MPQWLLLLFAVPTVTALIGWVTNWAAVKMVFYPAKFVGVGPVGWQGIMYRQGHKFAGSVADMVDNNLIDVDEILARIDADEVGKIVAQHLDPAIPAVCDAIVSEVAEPGTWSMLSSGIQTTIEGIVGEQARSISADVLAELQEEASGLIDVHSIVYTQLSGENLDRMARMTKRIGHREFKFIEYYGGFFGFLIGLLQVGAWQLFERWWLMPIAGVLVGIATNWLALQMIFRPQQPTKYLFGLVTYQGLFAKRQAEIAHDYAEMAAGEILTPGIILSSVLETEEAQAFLFRLLATASAQIRAELDKYQPMIPLGITDDMFERGQAVLLAELAVVGATARPDVESYAETTMQAKSTMQAKLASMSKDEFETVLRGIFKEDEVTLILVGGFLGGLVGLFQGYLVTAL